MASDRVEDGRTIVPADIFDRIADIEEERGLIHPVPPSGFENIGDESCTECLGEGAICYGPGYSDGQIIDPPSAEQCGGCCGTGLAEVQWVVAEMERARKALNNAIEALREVVNTHRWRPWDQATREKALARAQRVYETRGRDSGGE